MSHSIADVLTNLGFAQYKQKFAEYGVVNAADVNDFEEADWEALDVKPFHKKRIVARVLEIMPAINKVDTPDKDGVTHSTQPQESQKANPLLPSPFDEDMDDSITSSPFETVTNNTTIQNSTGNSSNTTNDKLTINTQSTSKGTSPTSPQSYLPSPFESLSSPFGEDEEKDSLPTSSSSLLKNPFSSSPSSDSLLLRQSNPFLDVPTQSTSSTVGSNNANDDNENDSELKSGKRNRRFGKTVDHQLTEDEDQDDGSTEDSPLPTDQIPTGEPNKSFIVQWPLTRTPRPPKNKLQLTEKPNIHELISHLKTPGKEIISHQAKALSHTQSPHSKSGTSTTSPQSYSGALVVRGLTPAFTDVSPTLSQSETMEDRDKEIVVHSRSGGLLLRKSDDTRKKLRDKKNQSKSKDSAEFSKVPSAQGKESLVASAKSFFSVKYHKTPPTSELSQAIKKSNINTSQPKLQTLPTTNESELNEDDINNNNAITGANNLNRFAVALYDNDEGENELMFKEGDKIKVIATDVSGWWTGELDGRTGFFPSNFVRLLPDE